MTRLYSRRGVLRAGTATAVLSALPRSSLFGQRAHSHAAARLDALGFRVPPEDMRALALRAVDAARAAGAVYADVRLTRTVNQYVHHQAVVRAGFIDREELGFGVRALVNGYWGFAASPYWDSDEAPRLAQHAVSQARTNALGTPRVVDWTPLPAATGTWICPGIDPFAIPVEEKVEFVNAWRQAAQEWSWAYKTRMAQSYVSFMRQEWFMASTEGTAIAQTFYGTQGGFGFELIPSDWAASRRERPLNIVANGLQLQRGGWDVLLDANIREQIPGLIERAVEFNKLGTVPVEIGRYDVVFDAKTSGSMVGNTFGIAAQVDRALGLEANAGGTSYLGPDPMAVLGTNVGAPLVNVSANRSMPKGNATVQWDDEGVLPEAFPLVTNGQLVDYQTTREQAPWLKAWYDTQHRPVRSHGCAASMSALYVPLQQPPNLVLQPGKTTASFETLVANTRKGYAFLSGGVRTDMQAKNGMGSGQVREIVNGKLGDLVEGAGFLFNSTEFWKSITALGDANTVQYTSEISTKGEPGQFIPFSVAAVPLAAKNVSIIDLRRRA